MDGLWHTFQRDAQEPAFVFLLTRNADHIAILQKRLHLFITKTLNERKDIFQNQQSQLFWMAEDYKG